MRPCRPPEAQPPTPSPCRPRRLRGQRLRGHTQLLLLRLCRQRPPPPTPAPQAPAVCESPQPGLGFGNHRHRDGKVDKQRDPREQRWFVPENASPEQRTPSGGGEGLHAALAISEAFKVFIISSSERRRRECERRGRRAQTQPQSPAFPPSPGRDACYRQNLTNSSCFPCLRRQPQQWAPSATAQSSPGRCPTGGWCSAGAPPASAGCSSSGRRTAGTAPRAAPGAGALALRDRQATVRSLACTHL